MSVSNIYVKLLLAFFFLMLVVPTTFQMQRGIFLAVLTLGAAVYALMVHWAVSKTIMLWLLVMVSAGVLFMWNGIWNDTPGALQVSTVYVVWPLLYVFFIGLSRRPETLIVLLKTAILGVLGSSLMGIVLVAATSAGFAENLSGLLQSQDAVAGFYDGFVRYRLPNVATLVYGTGFILGLVAIPKVNRWCSPGWTATIWLTLFAMLVAIVLSGRRAAWLVVLLVPVLIFGLMVVSRQNVRIRNWAVLFSLAVLAFLGIHAYLDLQLSALVREFTNAFDTGTETSASVRSSQSDVLIARWADRPILGHGLGAGTDIVRSLDQPWAYEVSYLALLFQTGLVGILIYGSGILWIFWAGIVTVRRLPESASVILPLLSGLAGFLIANATNPYLAKFDYLWVIFLPVAAINVYSRIHRLLVVKAPRPGDTGRRSIGWVG